MSRNRLRGKTRWANVRLTYLREREIDALLAFAKSRDSIPTQIILDALRAAGVENLQERVEVRKYVPRTIDSSIPTRKSVRTFLAEVTGIRSLDNLKSGRIRPVTRRSLSLSISLPAHYSLKSLTAAWRQANGGDYRCSVQAFMRRALHLYGVRGIGPIIRPSPAEIQCGENCNGLCRLTHIPCALFVAWQEPANFGFLIEGG